MSEKNKQARRIITREVLMKLLFQANSVNLEDKQAKRDLVYDRIKSIYDEIDFYIACNQDYLVERSEELTGSNLDEYIDRTYALLLCDALKDNIEEIDKQIEMNLKNWKIDRISSVDLSILRYAVCELAYIDQVPIAVVINEAVELAKVYGGEKSYKFVNGILANLKSLRSDK